MIRPGTVDLHLIVSDFFKKHVGSLHRLIHHSTKYPNASHKLTAYS